jgi:hypothetical protein
MALKTWTYLCSSCGHPYRMKLKEEEQPRSRYQLRCDGRRCRKKRRWFYPAIRPLTGNWRRA